MLRIVAAFIIAPFWLLPGLFLCISLWGQGQENVPSSLVFNIALLGTVLGHGGTALVGLPLFLVLINTRYVHWRTGATAGFIIAVSALVWLYCSIPASVEVPPTLDTLIFCLVIVISGPLIGITIWFIARPDLLPPRETIPVGPPPPAETGWLGTPRCSE